MSPANPNMQRHSAVHLANPENPIFQREALTPAPAVSPGQAIAVQTGTAPLPTVQTPLLNESVEPSPAAGLPSDADLDAIAAEERAAEATAPNPTTEGADSGASATSSLETTPSGSDSSEPAPSA